MKTFLLLFVLLLLAACGAPDQNAENSTNSAAVYYNGDILTMEGDEPQYVEAVVVKDGKIAFAGASRPAGLLQRISGN